MSKLKTLRMEKGKTLEELARALKITPQGVSSQEKAGIKKLTTAAKYAAILDCSPLELLDL